MIEVTLDEYVTNVRTHYKNRLQSIAMEKVKLQKEEEAIYDFLAFLDKIRQMLDGE